MALTAGLGCGIGVSTRRPPNGKQVEVQHAKTEKALEGEGAPEGRSARFSPETRRLPSVYTEENVTKPSPRQCSHFLWMAPERLRHLQARRAVAREPE